VPLFRIQQDAVSAIAANRHPGSHVAGGTVIHADGFRFSKDDHLRLRLSATRNRV
jgi:hypothetical protein